MSMMMPEEPKSLRLQIWLKQRLEWFKNLRENLTFNLILQRFLNKSTAVSISIPVTLLAFYRLGYSFLNGQLLLSLPVVAMLIAGVTGLRLAHLIKDEK